MLIRRTDFLWLFSNARSVIDKVFSINIVQSDRYDESNDKADLFGAIAVPIHALHKHWHQKPGKKRIKDHDTDLTCRH